MSSDRLLAQKNFEQLLDVHSSDLMPRMVINWWRRWRDSMILFNQKNQRTLSMLIN